MYTAELAAKLARRTDTLMEMIMSTICSAPVAAQRTAREPIKPQQLMGKQSTLAVLEHIIRYWHKADMS
ncbi:MAG: hypothetical protein WAL01_15110 [Pseudolabrys sp.]